MRVMEKPMNCVRCGGSAFATLRIEAAIGATRLKIRDDAGQTGLCAPCMIGLADWLMGGRDVESSLPERFLVHRQVTAL
jgi:hypothetical protein